MKSLLKNYKKKIATAFLVVAVVAIGTSQAAVLVYKVTASCDAVFEFTDANYNHANVSQVKVEAYVVLDVNLASYLVTRPNEEGDPNNPTVVIFTNINKSKKTTTLGGEDPNSSVWVGNQTEDEDTISPFTVLGKKNTTASVLWFEIYDDASQLYVEFWSLYGKNSLTDVGLAAKASLPKSLKGFGDFYTESSLIWGDGTVTAKLDSKYTTNANNGGLTVAQTVAQIRADLIKKKYVPAPSLSLLLLD